MIVPELPEKYAKIALAIRFFPQIRSSVKQIINFTTLPNIYL